MPVSARARPSPRPQTQHAAANRPSPSIFIGHLPIGSTTTPPPRPGLIPTFPPPSNMPVPIPLTTSCNVIKSASDVMNQAKATTRAMCRLFQYHQSSWTALQSLYNHAFTFYQLARQILETYKFLPQVECVARSVNQLQDGTAIICPSNGTLPHWDTRFANNLVNTLIAVLPCLGNIYAACLATLNGRRSQLVPTFEGPQSHWDTTYIEQKILALNNYQQKIHNCLIYCKFIHMVPLENLHNDYSCSYGGDDDFERVIALESYRTAEDALKSFWNSQSIHHSLKYVREMHGIRKGFNPNAAKGKKNQKAKNRTKGHMPAKPNSNVESKSNSTQSASCTQDMCTAIARSDYITVSNLITAGVDVNAMLQDGTFLLSHAVDNNNGALASLLALCGANPNARHRSGNTPLHFASNINRVAPALVLLEIGADVDARDAQGLTPLHVACRERHLPIVIHLLSHGADPNAYDNQGITPLGYALLHPQKITLRYDILDALLTYGALATSPSHVLSPLAQAVIRRNRDDFNACAKKGLCLAESETVIATTSSKNGGLVKLRPLYFSILGYHCFYVNELIRLGADIHHQVSRYGESISYLSVAIHSRAPSIVARVLAHGANPNAADRYGTTPLHIATKMTKCDTEIADLLIRHGADCSAKMYERHIQPLHNAAYYSRADICVSLIENGADVNEPVKNGISPFMLAIYGESKSVARCLMSKGADAKYHTPRFGETAMHAACCVGNLTLAAFLLEEGLSVNATYQFSDSAGSAGSIDSTDLANSHNGTHSVDNSGGAPTVVGRSCRGFAPIHAAAARGHLKMVRWLLKNGADAEARIGRTASRVCLSTEGLTSGAGGLDAYCSVIKDDGEASDGQYDKLDLGQTAAQIGRLFGHEPVASFIEDHTAQLAMEAFEAEEALLYHENSSTTALASTHFSSINSPTPANYT